MTPVRGNIELLAEAVRLGQTGAPAALATVVRTAGSTPRHPSAKMIVLADGAIVGTIGGGKIELEVIEAARAVARREAPPSRLRKHLVHDLAMCCGGEMELWLEPIDAARWNPIGEALRRRARRVATALVTAVDDPAAAGVGGKDLRADDECLRTRRARLDDGRFVEPVLPADRLVIFGAGHVARALAPIAASVGFELVVCDEDDAFATEERFPGARLLPTFDGDEVARALAADPGPMGAYDFVVILTRDHAVDQKILEQLLPRAGELAYLGLIGSRGKVGRFKKRLEAKGIYREDLWARLHAPVGLDVGAETPEEIAVAIVAELVRERHGAAAK